MRISYAALLAVLSGVATALAIGWANDLDYWQRISAIGSECTRPVAARADAGAREVSDPAAVHGIVDSPGTYKAEKPSDKETADGWLTWAKATRGRDSTWMPPVYSRLSDLKSVQSCVIEFRALQIESANARIVLHRGDRVWLTGEIPGLAANKSYSCKGLFAPAGTYQFKSSDGTQTLPAFHYLGEVPDLFATAK